VRKLAPLVAISLVVACVSLPAAGADACDSSPTGVERTDYPLHFTVPAGLMPDRRFDGRPAQIVVHRVQPVYASGKCASVVDRAAVLVHGRIGSGPDTFDLLHPAPDGGTLSMQEALARAGIDTFAPNLLGYSPSTTFPDGLDDLGNASLRAYESDGWCTHAEGCDRTTVANVFGLDNQGRSLLTNPLTGTRRSHSSGLHFASIDVWVRDIAQVVDDVIARARPADGRVTLVGYSLGATRVGRALYTSKHPDITAKVDRAAFLAPIFGGSLDEPQDGVVTFPLTFTDRASMVDAPTSMRPDREQVCAGYRVPGAGAQMWAQMMSQDTVGRSWGGSDAGDPAGLRRLPTFATFGFNAQVAGALGMPTLVMQGLDDDVPPGLGVRSAPTLYDALPDAMTNKVLVQVDCATHGFMAERTHATVKAALIEWITAATFGGEPAGRFVVSPTGVVNRTS
jgi:pimeloyl-ACP methyl ester carboxylesterase